MVRARPPRTAGHASRDAAIAQFAAAGLVPVLSTNGSNPEADIQIVKGAQPGEVLESWITPRGLGRLIPERFLVDAPAVEAVERKQDRAIDRAAVKPKTRSLQHSKTKKRGKAR